MTARFLPPGPLVGVLIPRAIDAARCAGLRAELERRGFAATGERYPADYRDNDRLVFDDDALAAALFAELGAHVPAELVVDGERWTLVGFNPRFRACRYRDGQAFCVHRDGAHVPSDELRSHLTVQLYLDDAPDRVGGHTRFYADARGETRWASIAPSLGAAIVFDHRLWHDGEAVTAGIKHVLRTDAMYRRAAAAAPSPDRRDVVGRHRGYAWTAIACADGAIASAGRDGTVRRWGPGAATIALGAGSVTTLVEDAERRLWAGTRSGAIIVVEPTGAHRAVASGLGAILALAAHGHHVVAATARGTLAAFTIDGAPAWTAPAHTGWAWRVAAHPRGFVSVGHDGRVVVTDPHGRGDAVVELDAPLRAVAALATGGLVVGDTRGWWTQLAPDGRVVAATRAHGAAITAVAVARDGTWVTSSEDGAVKRWRGPCELAAASTPDFVTSVALTATDDVVCAGYDGVVWRARLAAPVPLTP
ncbi:MAG: 2OG-Fe(II) oxygenase [Myxococcales bacterium]|nr:2OG-Fe(II) oxygenase [Myxococcales bacterium]